VVGLLGRPRLDGHVADGVVLTGEVDSFVGERLAQNLQRLAEAGGSLGERSPVQADARVLVFDGAASDAELQPTSRNLVKRGGHLGQHGGMAKLIAQHHMSDLDALGVAEQRGSQCPGLQRRVIGHPGSVQVVVEPERVDPEIVASPRAMQEFGIGEAHLRQIDADFGLGHDLSSNLPWVMVGTHPLIASNAIEFWSMP
jgi:hypothetical protein